MIIISPCLHFFLAIIIFFYSFYIKIIIFIFLLNFLRNIYIPFYISFLNKFYLLIIKYNLFAFFFFLIILILNICLKRFYCIFFLKSVIFFKIFFKYFKKYNRFKIFIIFLLILFDYNLINYDYFKKNLYLDFKLILKKKNIFSFKKNIFLKDNELVKYDKFLINNLIFIYNIFSYFIKKKFFFNLFKKYLKNFFNFFSCVFLKILNIILDIFNIYYELLIIKTLLFFSMICLLLFTTYVLNVIEETYITSLFDLLYTNEKYKLYEDAFIDYVYKRFKSIYLVLRHPYIVNIDFKNLNPNTEIINKKKYIFFILYINIFLILIHYFWGLVSFLYDYIIKKLDIKNNKYIIFFHISICFFFINFLLKVSL